MLGARAGCERMRIHLWPGRRLYVIRWVSIRAAHFFCQRPDGGGFKLTPRPHLPLGLHISHLHQTDRRAAGRRTANALDQRVQALARFRGQPAPPEERPSLSRRSVPLDSSVRQHLGPLVAHSDQVPSPSLSFIKRLVNLLSSEAVPY